MNQRMFCYLMLTLILSGHNAMLTGAEQAGAALEKVSAVAQKEVRAEAGLIYDWEPRWALEDADWDLRARSLTPERWAYNTICERYHNCYWRRGISVDVFPRLADYGACRVLLAPFYFLAEADDAKALEAFVAEGGTLVTSYWSGYLTDSKRRQPDGCPGPLRDLLGIRIEGFESLGEDETVDLQSADTFLKGHFQGREVFELIHLESAEAVAVAARGDFEGMPVITRNRCGKGTVIHIGAELDDVALDRLHGAIIEEAGLKGCIDAALPRGVSARQRGDTVFLLNFNPDPVSVVPGDKEMRDILGNSNIDGEVNLNGYETAVLKRKI